MIDRQSVTVRVDRVYDGTIRVTLALHGYVGKAYMEAGDGHGPQAWGTAEAWRT